MNAAGRRPDCRTVAQAARGRWPDLLPALGVPAAALSRRHGPCPGCGGRDRFRFDNRRDAGDWYCGGGGQPVSGDGFELLRHVHGWSLAQAMGAVADLLGLRAAPVPAPARPLPRPDRVPGPPPDAAADPANLRRLHSLTRESVPLDLMQHAPARAYFEARGLAALVDDPPAALRYCPALPYWTEDATRRPVQSGTWPALLAVVSGPDGHPVTLHRTYLAADGSGKAPVTTPRKLCPPVRPGALRGAAVRLYEQPNAGRLALAEGLETALAMRLALPDWPVWSCISAGGLAGVMLPPSVRDVLIGADFDRAGIDAAEALASRLADEGRAVRIALPDAPGWDFADLLADTAVTA